VLPQLAEEAGLAALTALSGLLVAVLLPVMAAHTEAVAAVVFTAAGQNEPVLAL
jgi:hypothetical protein